MKRNKTKVSDHYVMVSSRSTFCEGYSEPTFSTWFDYGLAHQAVKAELLKLCAMGWTITKTEVGHDENGLRNPGNMIKKMVSDTIKKIAKKEGVAEPKMKENLLNQGKKLLK